MVPVSAQPSVVAEISCNRLEQQTRALRDPPCDVRQLLLLRPLGVVRGLGIGLWPTKAMDGVLNLIHGHTHRPAVHEFVLDGTAARRYVLNDWYDRDGVLVCDAGGWRQLRVEAYLKQVAET